MYSVTIEGQYLYITVEGWEGYYQLKLDDEGLVLDFVNGEELYSLFHFAHGEY